jgi:hypothetical protein
VARETCTVAPSCAAAPAVSGEPEFSKVLSTVKFSYVRPAPEPISLGRPPLLSSRLEIREALSGGRAQGSRAVSIVIDLHNDCAGEGHTSVVLK